MTRLAWVLLAVGLLAVEPGGAATADRRTLWLRHVHTNEAIHVRPFARFGLPRPLGWARLNRFFRSTRTGLLHPMSPRLLRLLAQLQRHFGGRRIEIVSGYRVPERYDRLISYHQVGRAVDVRIPAVSNRDLFEACRKLPRTGCGLYPVANSHVHVDVRGEAAIWVDLSRSGERAAYVPDPEAWLRQHPDEGRR